VSASAETAIRAWVNARSDLITGTLARGAFLAGQQPRSPADGAYTLLARIPGGRGVLIAEDDNPTVARISALVYAGTPEAAEAAAADLASAFNSLNGCPEPCPGTDVTVLVSDNVSEPAYQPQPADAGEQYCFQVAADFVLRKDS
jgi:hypothetical protein